MIKGAGRIVLGDFHRSFLLGFLADTLTQSTSSLSSPFSVLYDLTICGDLILLLRYDSSFFSLRSSYFFFWLTSGHLVSLTILA